MYAVDEQGARHVLWCDDLRGHGVWVFPSDTPRWAGWLLMPPLYRGFWLVPVAALAVLIGAGFGVWGITPGSGVAVGAVLLSGLLWVCTGRRWWRPRQLPRAVEASVAALERSGLRPAEARWLHEWLWWFAWDPTPERLHLVISRIGRLRYAIELRRRG